MAADEARYAARQRSLAMFERAMLDFDGSTNWSEGFEVLHMTAQQAALDYFRIASGQPRR